jgi:hypothetical protein
MYVHRGIHSRLELVNAELVEVAEDDLARAVGDKAGPVVEGLTAVALEVGDALLHLEQDDGFSNIAAPEDGRSPLRPSPAGPDPLPPTSDSSSKPRAAMISKAGV